MRALIDYHHADLVESLHLLLTDRLGIDLYIPVGSEWYEAGVWQFGRWTWGDDRLARIRSYGRLPGPPMASEPGPSGIRGRSLVACSQKPQLV